MNRPINTGERSVALFMLAAMLFSPPLLFIFDTGTYVMGLPLLYLFLFAAWGVTIALLARITEPSVIPYDSASDPEAVAARRENGEAA
jgi:hypothetical protein